MNRHAQFVMRFASKLHAASQSYLNTKTRLLEQYKSGLPWGVKAFLKGKKHSVQHVQASVSRESANHISNTLQKLNSFEKQLQLVDPQNVLKRGFSITIHNDVPVLDAANLKDGDSITTFYAEGKTESIIKKQYNGS